MISEGHMVGNHSFNHANSPKLSDVDFRNQVTKTHKVTRLISGWSGECLTITIQVLPNIKKLRNGGVRLVMTIPELLDLPGGYLV